MGKKRRKRPLHDRLQSSIAANATLTQKVAELESAAAQSKERETSLNERINELGSEMQEKQRQLDKRELKLFAEAYDDQEKQYRKDADRWFRYVIFAFIVVMLATILVVYELTLTGYSDQIWYQRIGFYVIDLVLITFLVFCLKRYSYYITLSADYANRKTLAQSYFNILNSEEDADIRKQFLEKATSILCAPVIVGDDKYTIPEKIIESIAEVVKKKFPPIN